MPLAGAAFLALWNDIRRAREPEYDRWHTQEHVPERVAVAGIRGARRYVDRTRADQRYFTLYELDDLDVLESPEYRDLVDHPTPWSASMRPDFANVLRVPCTVLSSRGHGIGAAIAVLRYGNAGAHGDTDVLDAIAAQPGVVGVHRGVVASSERASAPAWTTGARTAAPRELDRVALLEALDRGAADTALAALADALAVDLRSPTPGTGVYDLAFAFPGHLAVDRQAFRRAHWPSRGA